MSDAVSSEPTDEDYAILAQFRRGLRRFNRFSEEVTAACGSTPAIYQLMLIVAGARGRDMDIAMAANALALEHHSASELVARAEQRGLVERQADPSDGRRVLLVLTAAGRDLLRSLAAAHRDEINRIYASTFKVLEGLSSSSLEPSRG